MARKTENKSDADECERLMAMRRPATITVIYPGGEVKDLAYQKAREEIAGGVVIETVPSDPERAKRWLADLRGRVMEEDKRNAGHLDRRHAFEAFEAWCTKRGLHALPATAETLVLYLISGAVDGVAEHVLRQRCLKIVAIHDLARHPPRNLAKTAWDAYVRAMSFARMTLTNDSVPLQEMGQRQPGKALQMFSDGRVPLRWCDLAA